MRQSSLSVAVKRPSPRCCTAVSTAKSPTAVRFAGLGELGEDLFAEEAQRLGVGVVGAPGHEAAATEVHVGPHLLGHLLGGADEVAGGPRLDGLAPEAAAAGVGDLLLGLPDEDLG